MAYADRTTMAMSPRATGYYDIDAEIFVLDELFESNTTPNVSADWFRWRVAEATWSECVEFEPFPFEDEEPYVHDVPCCEQYVRHWYLQKKLPPSMKGDRITVSSSTDATPLQVRKILAQSVHNSPLVLTPCGDPLAFPIPKVRKLELCVGAEEDMRSTMSEAASILGPEFTLSCSFGGRRRAVVTFGLAPGVDHNNENVILRARNPIDWLLDWWVNMLKGDTNLTEHLRQLARQRFTRPEDDQTVFPTDTIIRLEGKFTDMSKEDLLLAFKAQQRELDYLILRYAFIQAPYSVDESRRAATIMDIVENGDTIVNGVTNREDRLRVVQPLLEQAAVIFVFKLLMGESGMMLSLEERAEAFTRSGHLEFPFLDSELSRAKVVREAWSQVRQEMDYVLSRIEEKLN
ncbi:hypothetical protein PG985_001876 [Apiospora marii]|uniref:uncharacterized protein n=1 Tax=Apiospora marii TaxID=335849 RepID=UPI003131D63B